MSSGVRTVFLSRWRTGGQSSVDLAREFVQELPHTTPADAWQRAVIVVAENKINLDAEPRIKKGVGDEAPKGNHPFFWASCMLIDPGPPSKVDLEALKKPPKAKPGQDDAKKPVDGEQPKKAAGPNPPGKPPEVQPPEDPAGDAKPQKPTKGKSAKKIDPRKAKKPNSVRNAE